MSTLTQTEIRTEERTPETRPFFVVGGTMPPEAPSYVERPADRELYERVQAGELCHVLTTRQVGKSSLMARTARRLHDEEGVHVALVDLSAVGTQTAEESAEQWYFGVTEAIIDGLDLEVDLEAWWEKRERLPPVQRLVRMLRDLVLERLRGRVVIFFDEIDSTLSLPFTDDFFAAIRACYTLRATEPGFRRLGFVLLGVASPSDLISDRSHTPFNVGTRIELTDFTRQEARVLAEGLHTDRDLAERALERILYWTDGHPYLTQRLCALARGQMENGFSEKSVDGLVEEAFLAPGADRTEMNLRFVHDWLTSHPQALGVVLERYRRSRTGADIVDDPRSPIDDEINLSGLVKTFAGSRLKVRNRIYARTFDEAWIKNVALADVKGRVAV